MDNHEANSASPDQELKPYEGTTYEMNKGVNPREAGLSCESALGYELWETFKFIQEIDFDDPGNGDPEDLIPPIAKALYENFNRVNQLYATKRPEWVDQFDQVTEDKLIKNVILAEIRDEREENACFNLVFHRLIEPDRVWGGIYLGEFACLVGKDEEVMKKIEHVALNYTAKIFEVGKYYRMTYNKDNARLKDIEYLKEVDEWQHDG